MEGSPGTKGHPGIAKEGRAMPPLTDPERSRWDLNALGNWDVVDYVVWAEQARDWVRLHLSEYSVGQLAELLYLHVRDHGCACVDEQPERRPEWRDKHEFHHDLRVTIGGRRVYFETRLFILRHGDSYIEVVNAHDP
jgi:hypothetical protein